MKTEEKDKQAKDAARRSAARASKSKPGVVAVAADEASRFDQRIAEKQNAPAQAPASKPGAVSVAANEASILDQRISAKQRGIKPPPATSNTGPPLGELEADVAAKQRGRSTGGIALKRAPPSTGHTTLSTMESDVASKARFRTSTDSTPGAHAVSDISEDKVAGKVRREAAGTSPRKELNNLEKEATMVVGQGASARSLKKVAEVSGLEDSVATGSSLPGAFPENTRLEDTVAAKVRGETKPAAKVETVNRQDQAAEKIRRDISTTPGAHSEKTGLVDSVTAKIRREATGSEAKATELTSRTSSLTYQQSGTSAEEIARLDERIAAKTATMTGTGANQNNDADAKAMPNKDAKSAVTNKDEKKNSAGTAISKPGSTKKSGDKVKLSKESPEQALGSNPDDMAFSGDFDNKGLAIAVAVDDDPDDIFIPAAVEYDPDAKPPIYRNRRFRLYGLLVFLIIVLVAVGAAVGGALGKKGNEDEILTPTNAPTLYRESLGIEEQIKRIIGGEMLEDPESPYSKALEWITHDDPMQLTPEATNFIQRYTAAYFYYATTEDGPWRSCNPPEDPWSGETDCTFARLMSVFPMEFADVPRKAWLSNVTECEWVG